MGNELNKILNLTDEELKTAIFTKDEQTVEIMRQSLMKVCDASKAAYDSLDEGTINFLTAKHVKITYEEVLAANVFFQMVAGKITSED